jgi:hypothetical protein
MNPNVKSKIQMLGAWCAIGYIGCAVVGWAVIAGFLFPPTPPSNTAEQIAALFQTDFTRIRIGMVVVMIAALVMIPFAAVMSEFISRVEGGAGVLTYTFLLGSAGCMVLTFYPAIWWLVAAFRPDRDAGLIYLMNDMAWLQFLGGITMYLAMPFAVAAAAFFDESPDPVFPRWAAFVNIFLVLITVPDQLVFFFHKGPFAWNGLFGLWLPIVGFGGFWVVNFFCVRSAILRDRTRQLTIPAGYRAAC